ncbi:MAG: hypothetical protein COB37_08050 [Kordiimonadales bacterium]|nr:MAG: hypothetical protein COB37_08050 [Kordiimonadales bacterium]
MSDYQTYEARLKTSLWVEGHVRTCFTADMPAFVVAKGDADRGGVLLKINQFSAGISLYEQTLDFDGNKMWRSAGNFDAAAERDSDAAIAKKRQYDSDLWVIEIEDNAQAYQLDAPFSEF